MGKSYFPTDRAARISWYDNFAKEFPKVGRNLGFSDAEIANAMSDATRPRAATANESVAAPSTQKCVKCGASLQAGAKFCSECGTSQVPAKCSNCQKELPPGAKFCNECGTKVG